jgi:hypothetical protein
LGFNNKGSPTDHEFTPRGSDRDKEQIYDDVDIITSLEMANVQWTPVAR